jgi:hypothetical protein
LSHLVQNFLAEYQIPQVLQPPCSTEMATWLFSIPKCEDAVEWE